MSEYVLADAAGPMEWNSLSNSLRDPARCTNSFRWALKTHLFAEQRDDSRIRGATWCAIIIITIVIIIVHRENTLHRQTVQCVKTIEQLCTVLTLFL